MTNANQKLDDLTLISGSARVVALLLFLVSLLFALPCLAQNPSPSCTPPSTEHPTLQQAIDDPGCPTVHLQPLRTYEESILISRSLELVGGFSGSLVDGSITVTGASTQVSLSEMGVLRNCTAPGIQITMGAQITTSNVEIRTVDLECPCKPPSAQHPTLQQAIDDPGCPTIHLLAQTYGESILISRSLELRGAGLASSTVDGSITVTGASTQVSLSEMVVLRNCTVPGIQITMGAQITTSNVEIRTVDLECPELHGLPFSDGFEDV